MMNKRSAFLCMFLGMTVSCAIALAAAGRSVYYHDQALTRDARQINGRVYVPLADVARALGGHVVSRGGDYEIATGEGASPGGDAGRTAAGGAGEVRGANGAVGDWFFNGFWRFRVNRMERVDEYQYQYGPSSGSDKPAGENDELVVFHCTIKNGNKYADNPILTPYGTSAQKTALTDDQGQSYAPKNVEARSGEMAPGAARNFAIIFSVPKGTELKDLIFTVYSYGASNKPSNVRVHLANH